MITVLRSNAPAEMSLQKQRTQSLSLSEGGSMIGQKICAAMNEQIKHELESYIYLSMVAYFHFISPDGMAH